MQHVHAGMPLPDAIRNAPELREDLDIFYKAYMDLDSCRSVGMSIGPISWLTIKQYCDEIELFGDMREDMYYHIRALDNAYMDWKSKNNG